jgi:hypothetical protein
VHSNFYFTPVLSISIHTQSQFMGLEGFLANIVLCLHSYRTPILLFVDWRGNPSPGQSSVAPRFGARHGINAVHDARDMHDGSHGDSIKL